MPVRVRAACVLVFADQVEENSGHRGAMACASGSSGELPARRRARARFVIHSSCVFTVLANRRFRYLSFGLDRGHPKAATTEPGLSISRSLLALSATGPASG